MTDPHRRRFMVAAVVGVMVISGCIALVLGWTIPFPWGTLLGIAIAIPIGVWGGRLLRRVDKVGRHTE